MNKTIIVKCTNVRDCGQVNIFPLSDLIGEVPMINQDGDRIPPPIVELNENTFVKCSHCGYPIHCTDATISD